MQRGRHEQAARAIHAARAGRCRADHLEAGIEHHRMQARAVPAGARRGRPHDAAQRDAGATPQPVDRAEGRAIGHPGLARLASQRLGRDRLGAGGALGRQVVLPSGRGRGRGRHRAHARAHMVLPVLAAGAARQDVDRQRVAHARADAAIEAQRRVVEHAGLQQAHLLDARGAAERGRAGMRHHVDEAARRQHHLAGHHVVAQEGLARQRQFAGQQAAAVGLVHAGREERVAHRLEQRRQRPARAVM